MWEELKKEALGEKYQIYLVVKDAIDEWNPYGLLPEVVLCQDLVQIKMRSSAC